MEICKNDQPTDRPTKYLFLHDIQALLKQVAAFKDFPAHVHENVGAAINNIL